MNNTIAPPPAQLRPQGCPEFAIGEIERVKTTTALKAVFDVVLPGVVLRGCRLMIDARSRSWVAGPTTADRYARGGYRIHAYFSDELAAAILEVVLARLAADEGAGEA